MYFSSNGLAYDTLYPSTGLSGLPHIFNIILTPISAVSTLTPQSASAYEKNQATSQTSACGNDFVPINIGCQNIDSQIQGDENAAALTAQQTFPEVKLVQEKPNHPPKTLPPEPEPEPQTCEDCLAPLLEFPGWASGITTEPDDNDQEAIEAICEALENQEIPVLSVSEAIRKVAPTLGIDEATADSLANEIAECLNMLFGELPER